MSKYCLIKRIKSSSGSALVELAFSIPVILIALLGSMEFTRIFEASQIVSSISREAANIAHRNCFYAASVNTCVHDPSMFNINAFENYGNGVLPGVETLLSVYQVNTTTSPWSVSLITTVATPGYNPGINPSHFQSNTINNFGVSALNDKKQMVMIAESFYDYSKHLPLVKKFKLMPFLFKLYEITIF